VDGLWRLSRSTAQQAFGTSVHAALREFYRLPVGRRSLRMLLELFRRGWVRDGYRGKEEQQRERERGAEALRAWYARTDTTVVPHATELGLQATWGDIILKGRLDRVDADPGSDRGLVVVDYKTGRRPVSQESADTDEALTIYAALVERRLGRPVTRMVLDYVVAGTQVVTERPPEVLRQRLDDVLGTAATLRADQAYLPRTGPWCAGCDLLKRCPEGQREVAGVTARLD
jgi:RecB family exonuclease